VNAIFIAALVFALQADGGDAPAGGAIAQGPGALMDMLHNMGGVALFVLALPLLGHAICTTFSPPYIVDSSGLTNVTWFVDICFQNDKPGCNRTSGGPLAFCQFQGHSVLSHFHLFDNDVVASYVGSKTRLFCFNQPLQNGGCNALASVTCC